MMRKLLFLFVSCCVMMWANANAEKHTSNQRRINQSQTQVPQKQQLSDEVQWKLIYSDAQVKLYATAIECSGTPSLRLKFESLSATDLQVSYKIWENAVFSKPIKLSAKLSFEGICAPEYNNLLVEAIPAGASVADVKVQVNYQP